MMLLPFSAPWKCWFFFVFFQKRFLLVSLWKFSHVRKKNHWTKTISDVMLQLTIVNYFWIYGNYQKMKRVKIGISDKIIKKIQNVTKIILVFLCFRACLFLKKNQYWHLAFFYHMRVHLTKMICQKCIAHRKKRNLCLKSAKK